jgi:hypothetical protein
LTKKNDPGNSAFQRFGRGEMEMLSIQPWGNHLLYPVIAITHLAWLTRQVLDLRLFSAIGHLYLVATSEIPYFSVEPPDIFVFLSSLQGEASFSPLQRN